MNNLKDCFIELEKMLDPEMLEEFKNTPENRLAMYHHGLGRFLRNKWHLWSDGSLKAYFNNIGIKHPDDMSGIILESFRRHLNDEPIDLESQVEYYKEYWRKCND